LWNVQVFSQVVLLYVLIVSLTWVSVGGPSYSVQCVTYQLEDTGVMDVLS
jgi:hypothetical protein